jgi:Bacterial surface protein, Ig-like domain
MLIHDYLELGATANDERDCMASVTISGNVNTSLVGDYIMTYNNANNTGTAT